MRDNDCQIMKGRRNNCPLCRYNKCLEVGMSKEGMQVKQIRPKKKKSCFQKPYQPFFFGATVNFFGTSENFSNFRVFLIIFMLLLYKKSFQKIFLAHLPTQKNIET